MNFKEEIEKVESQFSSLEKGKRYIIYFLVVSLITGLNYYYFVEDIMKDLTKERQNLEKLQRELRNKSPLTFVRKIKQEEKRHLKLSEEIEKLEYEKLTLRTKLDEMKFLFLTDDKFAQFLDVTLKDSVNKGIILSKVMIKEDNSGKHYIGSIYYAKEVEFEGKGDYLNIEEFLRNIEKQNILQRFDLIEIKTDVNSTWFNAKMTLFGDKE